MTLYDFLSSHYKPAASRTVPAPLESMGQWKKGGVGTKRVKRIKSGWAQTLEERP